MRRYWLLSSALGLFYPLMGLALPNYRLPTVDVTTPQAAQTQQSSQLGTERIISAQAIQAMGATSLTQVLAQQVDVQLIQGLDSSPEILLRGKPALVLLNGLPLRSLSMAAPALNMIDLTQVQAIIITPGSAGVQYGDQAIGGVVNIITRTPTKRSAAVTVTGGWPWSQSVELSGAEPLAQGWTVSGHSQLATAQGYRDHSGHSLQMVGFTAHKQLANGFFTWQSANSHDTQQYPGALNAAEVAQNRRQSEVSGQETSGDTLTEQQWHWHQAWATDWQSDSAAQYQQQWSIVHSYDQSDSSVAARSIELQQSVTHERSLWTYPLVWTNGITGGFDQYAFAGYIDNSHQEHAALYSEGVLHLPARVTLASGVRGMWVDTRGQFYDVDDSPAVLEPPSTQINHLGLVSVELRQRWQDHWQGYLRRADSVQLPFVDQSSYSPVVGRFGLEPQTATSYEVGVNQAVPNRWSWSSEWFVMNVKNEIAYAQESQNTFYNLNLPPTRHLGVLLNGHYDLSTAWTWGGQLAAERSWFLEGADQGKQLPQTPEWRLTLNSRYRWQSGWSVYGESQYTGSELADGDFANALGKIPGYWLLNATLGYHWQTLSFHLRLDNLLGKEYNLYTVATPDDEGDTNASQISYYPAPGRTAMLSVRYAFA